MTPRHFRFQKSNKDYLQYPPNSHGFQISLYPETNITLSEDVVLDVISKQHVTST